MTRPPISTELANLIASVRDADWDKRLIEQAIYIHGEDGRAFSMNTFRALLPEMAHGIAGRVFLSMLNRKESPIEEVGRVRSTSATTHRKFIGVYVLTEHGQTAAADWHAKYRQQVAA